MLSDIFMTARLGEKIKDRAMRYIELERPVTTNKQYVVDLIPTRHWSNLKSNVYMSLKPGAIISIRGRLEVDDSIGVIVVVEEYLTLSSNPKMNVSQGV